jgi:hypothetical protein
MKRKGKIAHLPLNIRETLNGLLCNGVPGNILVAWLNSLPEVCAILATQFQGRPITEQNLSGWKRGAFRDWLHNLETTELARRLLAFSATERSGPQPPALAQPDINRVNPA